jgi:RNase P subunit RPR2
MSDPYGTDVQQQVISFDEAMRFIRQGTHKHTCRECNSPDFQPIIDAVDGPVSQVHMRMRGGGFFPAVAFVCENCGAIFQISWQHVRSWLNNNPAPNG